VSPALKRRTVYTRVPVEIVKPALVKLLKEYGSQPELAKELLREGRGVTVGGWKRMFERILSEEYKFGVTIGPAEVLLTKAGHDLPSAQFKQTIYRVSGFYPTGKQTEFGKWTVRTWYYISERRALYRKRRLEEQGRFIEWAFSTEVVWVVL